MFYRFKCGAYVQANSFEEARKKLVTEILAEDERLSRWHKCTCTGLDHSSNCPEAPDNKGEIPF